MPELYQSLVTVDLWTLAALILNLLIQMYLIKRFLLDKVKAVIEKRRLAANAEIEEARQARQAAETMKADYERNLSEAHGQASLILATAQESARDHSELILGEARTRAEAMLRRAESQIEYEKKKAADELKTEIGGMAVDIASKVMAREIREEDHKDFIEDFIRSVGGAR